MRWWLVGVAVFLLGFLTLPYSCVGRCDIGEVGAPGGCVTQSCKSPLSLVSWPGGIRPYRAQLFWALVVISIVLPLILRGISAFRHRHA